MKYLKYTNLIILSFMILACKPQPRADIVVGTIAGPETDLVKVAQTIAQTKYGLTVKIIEFNDYQLPNEALGDGSLDLNIYQHEPFLKASIKARNYPIKALAKTFIFPMGIYSNRFKALNDLPAHAIIAIPNDPSNETRALRLLQTAGLITCKNKDLLHLGDITNNPKQFKIKELDAAQLPRLLQDVDAAIINTTYAIPAGLKPEQDAIFLENKSSDYANLIVGTTHPSAPEKQQQFIEAMHHQAVIDKAHQLFGEAVIVAWN